MTGGDLAVLGTILAHGRERGTFRDVEPMVVQMSIVAPLLLFAASAPVRQRLGSLVEGAAMVPRAALVDYLERAAVAALRPDAPNVRARTSSRSTRS